MQNNELREYQIAGAEFLTERRTALLADAMGLGKSAQAIRACDNIGAMTVLVVCPASLRENWRREFTKFSTFKRTIKVMSGRDQICDGAVNVVSYDTAVRLKEHLSNKHYDALVLDEAHYLKSLGAKRTQVIYGWKGEKGIVSKADRIWLLTGTPAPNNPIELYPMCKALFSESFSMGNGLAFSKFAFMRRYCVTKNNGFGEVIIGGKNLAELRVRLDPHFLRRKKEDVLKELPPITFDTLYLTADAKLAVADKGLLEQMNKVQAALDTEDPMASLEALAAHVATLRRYLGLTKVAPLVAWLKDFLEGSTEKIVVFGHHKDVLTQIRLAVNKITNVACITGETTDRDAEVQKFQNDPKCRVFIGNIQAAGTGLTLTAASNLVFAEYSWVPAENEQAAMRVHRIGQENAVIIRYAVVSDSLDERIAAVVKKKSDVIKQVFV